MKKNKFLSFVLVLCITIGLLPTFSANAETLNTTTITLTEPDLNQPPTIEPRFSSCTFVSNLRTLYPPSMEIVSFLSCQ